MSEFTKHDDRTAKDKTQYKEMKSDHRGNHRGNETRWQSKKQKSIMGHKVPSITKPDDNP